MSLGVTHGAPTIVCKTERPSYLSSMTTVTTPDPAFDVDQYLRRIGYDGDRAPTLDTLRAIHRLHPEAIAFENLDPLLGRPVTYEPGALHAKLVSGGRGGWCFEQNAVLRLALTALGFRTTGLAGRVLFNRPAGEVAARSHMLLLVHLDEGRYAADVGFGSQVLTAPLQLVHDEVQRTPHARFRYVRDERHVAPDEASYVLETDFGDRWAPIYRFDLVPHEAIDYAVTSWYLCTNPVSHFLHTLIAARVDGDVRRTLRDAVLTARALDGSSTSVTLTTRAELRDALTDVFLLTLPDDPGLDPALDAALARTAASAALTAAA